MSHSEKSYRVLVADDQPAVLDALKMLLRAEGMDVSVMRSPQVVLDSMAMHEYDVLLLDLNYARDTTSGREGIELIAKIKEIDSQVPILVMTAWGTIDLAVEAVRLGARDFIQKPWDDERLLNTLRTQAELYRALRRGQRLEAENKLFRKQGKVTFIAEAPAMRNVVEAIAQVGPSDANVLITGEHGTGKEVVAQMLHTVSLRNDKPLITVNTGGLPEGTFESELFGHVRGAFTDAKTERIGRFEMADGGTLFLDEIANVPVRQQAKLLRVLETGELERVGCSRTQQVNVRVVSATNADLTVECAAGNFREDLFFRLNTVEIHIPPLRERREDILVLASHFLSKYTSRYRKQIKAFSTESMEKLLEYSWPGNVRELDHTVERAVIMSRDEEIQPGNLGLQFSSRSRSVSLGDMSLEEAEALLISKALARYGGNISQAAEVLGLSRGTFYRRMEKHGLYAASPVRKEK
ncbi:MAG TPA: sigma-54 dependent transcriptional regulator [Candidatus Polarisedimenticolia bacterium]|jgi:DNA-binding NtrC family response regulator|nr:sigma-54 dependent transcriptional regulator [Candidatus Polarisedimenticolia bacterium]